MMFHLGTSGFAYGPWRDKFYPKKWPIDQMLAFYGERFRTVEVNNTFYRLSTASAVKSWTKEVGGEFRFAADAPVNADQIARRTHHDDDQCQHTVGTFFWSK